MDMMLLVVDATKGIQTQTAEVCGGHPRPRPILRSLTCSAFPDLFRSP